MLISAYNPANYNTIHATLKYITHHCHYKHIKVLSPFHSQPNPLCTRRATSHPTLERRWRPNPASSCQIRRAPAISGGDMEPVEVEDAEDNLSHALVFRES